MLDDQGNMNILLVRHNCKFSAQNENKSETRDFNKQPNYSRVRGQAIISNLSQTADGRPMYPRVLREVNREHALPLSLLFRKSLNIKGKLITKRQERSGVNFQNR